MRNKLTLIGWPKPDDVGYSEKVMAILKNSNRSVTVVRKETPCCGGIVMPAKVPHDVYAVERFKMMLTALFPGNE